MGTTFRMMLCPEAQQEVMLVRCAGLARFAYNWALDYEQKQHEAGKPFVSEKDLQEAFLALQNQEAYQWICHYSSMIPRQAIKEAVRAYQDFFRGIAKFPVFRSKRKTKPDFCMDAAEVEFSEMQVRLQHFNRSQDENVQQETFWIALSDRRAIPADAKYSHPRITFDGSHWWISVAVQG